MNPQKIHGIRKKARDLAKVLHPTPSTQIKVDPDSTMVPEFRPITGTIRTMRIPRLDPAKMRKRRGGPKRQKRKRVTVLWTMRLFKSERALWNRSAADLGISTAMLIRLAMRYFLGGKQMRAMLAQGEFTTRFKKTVQKGRLYERAASVMAPEPHTRPVLPPEDDDDEDIPPQRGRLMVDPSSRP